MKTNDLIKQLSGNLAPTPKNSSWPVSFLAWFMAPAIVLFAAFYFLPLRADLGSRSLSILFQAQTVLCIAMFVAALLVARRSAIPGALSSRDEKIGWAILAVMAVVLASQVSLTDLRAEFWGEMDFYRGRCGPILLIIGTLDAALAAFVARKAASTRPGLTGVWIALSAAALGLIVTQFICDHENFLHVVIWHFTPVAILVGVGVALGRRVFKW